MIQLMHQNNNNNLISNAHIVEEISTWTRRQCICALQCIPEPHHLLPHLNPEWFYLSGTGLPRLSWKSGH